MIDIAVIFGADRARAEKELKESLDFEIKLANVSIEFQIETLIENYPILLVILILGSSIYHVDNFQSFLTPPIVRDNRGLLL